MAQRRRAVLLRTPCPALLRAGVGVGASAGSCPLLGRLLSPAPHLAPQPSRARSLPGSHLRWAAPPGLQEGGLRWGGDPSWGKDRPVREDIFWAIGRVLRVLVLGMGASWGRKRPEGEHVLGEHDLREGTWVGGRRILRGAEHILGEGTSWGRAFCGPIPAWAPPPGAPSAPSRDSAVPRAAAGLCATQLDRAPQLVSHGDKSAAAPAPFPVTAAAAAALR